MISVILSLKLFDIFFKFYAKISLSNTATKYLTNMNSTNICIQDPSSKEWADQVNSIHYRMLPGHGLFSFSFFFKFNFRYLFFIQKILISYFIHISVYMSIPISQFITPPPPSHHFPILVSLHLFSTSVSLFLPC